MRSLFILILFFFSIHSFGHSSLQSLNYRFRVYLKDKGITTYTLDQPERFLSLKAIERRKDQNVAVDETDLPISRDYFKLLEKAGGKVVSHSKWFRTITVQVTDSLLINDKISRDGKYIISSDQVKLLNVTGADNYTENNHSGYFKDRLDDLRLEFCKRQTGVSGI